MSDIIVIELGDTGILGVDLQDALPFPVNVQAIGVTGPPGVSAAYEHTQSSAATTWTIPHNLGFRPSVTSFSVGGVEIEGAVTHLGVNTCTISFAVAVAGLAHCV